MKEKSETEYIFSTKIPEPLEGEGTLGVPPRQLPIKYPRMRVNISVTLRMGIWFLLGFLFNVTGTIINLYSGENT